MNGSSTTYYILLLKFKEQFPAKLCAFKVTIGFQHIGLPTYPPLGWFVTHPHFLTPCRTSIWHLTQLTTTWKASSLIGKPMTTQHHQKLHLMISRFFLLVSGTQSRLLPPQVPPPLSNMNLNCTWTLNHWHPPIQGHCCLPHLKS